MNGHHHNKGDHHGLGHGQHGKSEGGYCICMQCGYTVNHQPGTPCKSVFCPQCNTSLVRSGIPATKSVEKLETMANVNPGSTDRKILYPKVVTGKCTACGVCIEICPTQTIVFENGKAFVNIDNCRNCRICMRACPENAFILG